MLGVLEVVPNNPNMPPLSSLAAVAASSAKARLSKYTPSPCRLVAIHCGACSSSTTSRLKVAAAPFSITSASFTPVNWITALAAWSATRRSLGNSAMPAWAGRKKPSRTSCTLPLISRIVAFCSMDAVAVFMAITRSCRGRPLQALSCSWAWRGCVSHKRRFGAGPEWRLRGSWQLPAGSSS